MNEMDLNILNNYLKCHPEDSLCLKDLMFAVGLSRLIEILKNADGRKVDITYTLDLNDKISWRYLSK